MPYMFHKKRSLKIKIKLQKPSKVNTRDKRKHCQICDSFKLSSLSGTGENKSVEGTTPKVFPVG